MSSFFVSRVIHIYLILTCESQEHYSGVFAAVRQDEEHYLYHSQQPSGDAMSQQGLLCGCDASFFLFKSKLYTSVVENDTQISASSSSRDIFKYDTMHWYTTTLNHFPSSLGVPELYAFILHQFPLCVCFSNIFIKNCYKTHYKTHTFCHSVTTNTVTERVN